MLKLKTVEDIIKAQNTSEVFDMDITSLDSQRDQYLDFFKPKQYETVDIFLVRQRIIFFYRQALEEIESGIVKPNSKVPLFKLECKGEEFILYDLIEDIDSYKIFSGTCDNEILWLKVPHFSRDERASKKIHNEYNILSHLHHHSLPHVEEEIIVNGSHAIIMHEIRGIKMSDFIKKYPNGIPAVHVAWMIERLLSIVGYIQNNMISHNHINLDNLILNKETHNITLIDFRDATLDESNEFFNDIQTVGRILINILGASSVQTKMKDFIYSLVSLDRASKPEDYDAWKLWTKFQDIRTELFGYSRFQKLE